MRSIRVEVSGRALVFNGDRVVKIGRAPDADIVLTGPSTSRAHAELRPDGQGWHLVDLGSQHGTHISGRAVKDTLVPNDVTVLFGRETDGSLVRLLPTRREAPLGPPLEATRAGTPRPAHTVAANAAQGAGSGLVVRVAGRDHSFGPGHTVSIGRDPGSDVVCEDPTVSRHHGRLEPQPYGWLYIDSSSTGTYTGARRRSTIRIDKAQRLRLGHPAAGVELTITPVYPAAVAQRQLRRRSRRKRGLALVAGLATVAVTIATAVFVLRLFEGPQRVQTGRVTSTSPPPTGLTSDELDRAKAATVLLSATTVNSQGMAVSYSGSGSIIDPNGMILTNAHVAAPHAPGLASRYPPSGLQNPPYLAVSLTRASDDRPADAEYRARLVRANGYIDAAIVQIYANADGSPLSAELDLPTVPIGDSDELRTGDDITILGFPGISDSRAVSVTRGVVSTFIKDSSLPGPRGEIDTDARIAPGNSGGLAINDNGQIIGIPSAYRQEAGSPIVSGRVRPINQVKPLIARAAGE